MNFLEKQFEEKLNLMPKEEGKFRYEKCFSFFNHSFRLGNYKSSRVDYCLELTNYNYIPELAKWPQYNVSDKLYSETLQKRQDWCRIFILDIFISIASVFIFISVFCCSKYIYCFKVKRKLCPCKGNP